jgi:serine/threonine-protein kinase
VALTPGLLLADRYRLTARIAVGGMGEVWTADDTRLARRVAVKILKSELTSDPEFVDRFRSEARITASLNHPGIAAVHDYGEVASIAGGPRDTAYLVMELVTGEPLSAALLRTPRLSAPRTLDVLEQSGRALQVAHGRNLVHRDIKPGNILITPAGQVKITDFGIAKVAHQVPVTRSGMVMGTAQYLAPEQAAGREALPASDVYALGVVAFECLAGRRPFDGDSPIAVATAHVQQPPPPLPADVPPPVAALVMRMLSKDPAQRYPDGASLAAACAVVRSGAMPPIPPGAAALPGAPLPAAPLPGAPILGAPRPGVPQPGAPLRAAPLPGAEPLSGAAGPHSPLPAGAAPGQYSVTGPGAPPGHPQATGFASPHPGAAIPTGPSAASSPLQVYVTRARPAPVRRHTGLAVVLVLLVLAVAAAVAAILLTRPESPAGAACTRCVVVSAPLPDRDLVVPGSAGDRPRPGAAL